MKAWSQYVIYDELQSMRFYSQVATELALRCRESGPASGVCVRIWMREQPDGSFEIVVE